MKPLESRIWTATESIIRAMGFEVVELKAAQTKKNHHVVIILYRPQGVSIDDCGNVLKTILPRLQAELDDQDVRIEVSSPGIERTIKSDREYAIFKGRGVRIMRSDESDWRVGLIGETDERGLTLVAGDEQLRIAYTDIKKARLDHTQEVG